LIRKDSELGSEEQSLPSCGKVILKSSDGFESMRGRVSVEGTPFDSACRLRDSVGVLKSVGGNDSEDEDDNEDDEDEDQDEDEDDEEDDEEE